MNDSTKPVPTFSSTTALIAGSRRVAGAIMLMSLALAMLAGCANPDKKKNRKPKPVRDPVEHRVFYEGWWPGR